MGTNRTNTNSKFDLGQKVEVLRNGFPATPAKVVGWNGPYVLVQFTHPKSNGVTEMVRPRNLRAV